MTDMFVMHCFDGSQMYVYLQTHQVVYIKYGQLFVC